MENSLKNVKNKINKKIRNIIFTAVAAVIVFAVGFYLLFEVAIREISMEDVSVSAEVYSLAEQVKKSADGVTDSKSITIFSDEEDNSKIMDVKIPGIGNISLTENTIENALKVLKIAKGE